MRPSASVDATDHPPTQSDHRTPRSIASWTARVSEAGVVIAWLLFVLRYQYRAGWLARYDLALDAVFLIALAAAAVARGVERHGMARVRSVLLRLVFAAAVGVVAIVAAELAARFEFRRARSSGNVREYVAQRGGGPPLRLNALGFRDREVPTKMPDRYRIAVVGDSFTWGQGIEERERFSNLLQDELGARYEVFNFGLPGNNLPEHLDVLARALTIDPDFVLLQLYINDFETPAMERPRAYPLVPGPLNEDLERSSLLYDLVEHRWVGLQEWLGITESYAHYMERNLRDPNSPNAREAFGRLHEFFARARAAHVKAGAVLFPATDAMGPSGSGYPFRYLHDGVREACITEHVSCLDLLPLFSTFRDPRAIWVSPFDAHPNATANRRAAFEILKEFGPAWQH